MNNTFNINRFTRLFIKHSAEHYKSYLMALTVLIGVMLLGGSFITYLIPGRFMDTRAQSELFMSVLLLAGTIFTSTLFADMGDNKKAVASLILPASHFEKYLVAWLYSVVIFIIVFTGSFYLILLLLANLKHFPGPTPQLFNVFDDQKGGPVFLLFALFQSIVFYGAICFKKLHFIKTAFAFFIAIAISILCNKIILGLLLGRSVLPTMPFGMLKFMENNQEKAISLGRHQGDYATCLIAILVVIFWVAAYYRLKEKQV
ncbi:MAG TPA: hypothetical protein VIJ27_12650 [Mucilaginibacter sp.]